MRNCVYRGIEVWRKTAVHLLIYSGYVYSTSSSPLLLRGAPDTARILDLPKVSSWSGIQTHNPSDERHQISLT